MLSSVDVERLPGAVDAARDALAVEVGAATTIWEKNRENLRTALECLARCDGRILVCGLGKSGHIGRKIAASMASLGRPSYFLHATEALHGDFGMCTPEDLGILISYSGATAEVVQVGRMMKRLGMGVVTMTRGADTPLGGLADANLDISVSREADPLGLAPTASALATLMLGDALAIGLQNLLDFQPEDFAQRHPGGSLGQLLADRRSEG